jgi:hypothetical protein
MFKEFVSDDTALFSFGNGHWNAMYLGAVAFGKSLSFHGAWGICNNHQETETNITQKARRPPPFVTMTFCPSLVVI